MQITPEHARTTDKATNRSALEANHESFDERMHANDRTFDQCTNDQHLSLRSGITLELAQKMDERLFKQVPRTTEHFRKAAAAALQ